MSLKRDRLSTLPHTVHDSARVTADQGLERDFMSGLLLYSQKQAPYFDSSYDPPT